VDWDGRKTVPKGRGGNGQKKGLVEKQVLVHGGRRGKNHKLMKLIGLHKMGEERLRRRAWKEGEKKGQGKHNEHKRRGEVWESDRRKSLMPNKGGRREVGLAQEALKGSRNAYEGIRTIIKGGIQLMWVPVSLEQGREKKERIRHKGNISLKYRYVSSKKCRKRKGIGERKGPDHELVTCRLGNGKESNSPSSPRPWGGEGIGEGRGVSFSLRRVGGGKKKGMNIKGAGPTSKGKSKKREFFTSVRIEKKA